MMHYYVIRICVYCFKKCNFRYENDYVKMYLKFYMVKLYIIFYVLPFILCYVQSIKKNSTYPEIKDDVSYVA